MRLSPARGADVPPVVAVEALSVEYDTPHGRLKAIEDVCLTVRRGEIFALVGESGSGKTTLALQLLGFSQTGARQLSGRVILDGQDITRLSGARLQAIRGRRVSYVPQNPTTALNPARKVGDVLGELLKVHRCVEPDLVAGRVRDLLANVALQPELVMERYPHQLSGGQQQRVALAMALACEPDLVVLDEPTTGLEVTTQKQVLELLVELRVKLGTSMLYVTHDLGVVKQIADRIAVMYAGSLVEIGATPDIFAASRHPYTMGLIASMPRVGVQPDPAQMLHGSLKRSEMGAGCPFQPRCPYAVEPCRDEPQQLGLIEAEHLVACREWPRIASNIRAPREVGDVAAPSLATSAPLLKAHDLSIRYGGGAFLGRLTRSGPPPVVRNVSFEVRRGEIMALVGESGSGKSTIARAVSGLVPLAGGSLTFDGSTLSPLPRRDQMLRRRIQLVFQNPDASLNPRRTVEESLLRPLALFFDVTGDEARRAVARMLDDVRLPPSYAARYPGELSGGERQRIAIGRALLARPDLMLCDEILSALDVSVQANILELLKQLRRETGVAMIFISHDLAVVEQIADTVIVLKDGNVADAGTTARIFQPPHHPYTLALLLSVPGAGGPSTHNPAGIAIDRTNVQSSRTDLSTGSS